MAYDQNGKHLDLDQTVTVNPDLTATVNVNLVKGVQYQFVFWAQKPDQYTAGIATDKKSLTIAPAGMMNSDDWDAFYWHEPLAEVTGPFTKDITLRRPFAQINVGAPVTLNASDERTAGDFFAASKSGIAIDPAALMTAYTLKVNNTLDLLTGAISGEAEVDMALLPRPDEFLTVSGTKYDYAAMAYVLAGPDEGATLDLELKLQTKQNGTTPINLTRSVPSVPIRRNYRTNILGNVFTVEGTFNIIVDPIYYIPDYVVTTTTDAEGNSFTENRDDAGNLVSLYAVVKTDSGLSTALTTNAKEITITLEEDNLKYTYAGYPQVGGTNTENITINGNGKTLVFGGRGDDSNMLNGNITIKNATVDYDNIGGNNAWNARSISVGGNLIAEDVVFNNEAAARGLKAEFKNCTFKETTANYALWLAASLEDVVVDNCTFTATNGGRGIKIADQYIDEADRKQVNLTIGKSTFTTAKKAAILVTNTAGAKITVPVGADNNISAVTEDTVNLVWNDADRDAAWDDVEVTNCTKKQE